MNVKISVVFATFCLAAFPYSAHAGTEVQLDVEDAGNVTITEAAKPTAILMGGDRETPFGLRLPDDAECPGDSATDQWRVESFVIPGEDDPADIRFASYSLATDGQWPLLDVDSQKFLAEFMPENPAAGLPGQIPDLPTFTFELYGRNELPEGRYTLGIACSYFNKMGVFWSTQIDLKYESGDPSSDFQWHVVTPPAGADGTAGQDSSSSTTWFVALGAAATGLIFVLYRRRNHRRHDTANLELK